MADGDKVFGELQTNAIVSNEPSIKKPFRVAYIHTDSYTRICDHLPKVPMRASLTHALIEAYGLTEDMLIEAPSLASDSDVGMFHSENYIECLKRMSANADEDKVHEDAETFGLVYDCPAFPGVYSYAALVAGASIRAAELLNDGTASIAINWPGGWHHAKRDEAAGFCYFNDLVLAILKLRKKFERILYVDIDLHHGDGVEDAFCSTPSVMTVSFHKHSPGFFPGSGDISEVGIGKGRYHAVNVPLKDGLSDNTFLEIFTSIMKKVKDSYDPLAVVLECGVDGLAEDPCSSFNLSSDAYTSAVTFIADWGLPLLLTGGGGYNFVNAARCWTSVTAAILRRCISNDIPEHKFFTKYGPDYELKVDAGNQRDKNTEDSLNHIITTVNANLERL